MEPKGEPLYAASSSVDINRSVEEDPLVDGPLISPDALHSAIRREFQPLPTPYHAVLLSFLHVVYVVLSVCVAVLCVLKYGREQECVSLLVSVTGLNAVVFGKVGLWLLVQLFVMGVRHYHNRARSRGYLRFYRNTRNLKHLPLIIYSTGNALLLVVLSAGLSESVLVYMVIGILGLELLVALPCLFVYTVRVMRFNRERAAPDVSHEEQLLSYSNTTVATETGFRESSSLEELVEKQADLIEYLKQHNTVLSKRLLNLTAQH